jgi:hypothetical protein
MLRRTSSIMELRDAGTLIDAPLPEKGLTTGGLA